MKESLSEFLEPDESDADIARPFFNGHNRYVGEIKINSIRSLETLWKFKKVPLYEQQYTGLAVVKFWS